MISELQLTWVLKGKQEFKKVQIGGEERMFNTFEDVERGSQEGQREALSAVKVKNFNEVLKFNSSTKMVQTPNYLNHVNLSRQTRKEAKC